MKLFVPLVAALAIATGCGESKSADPTATTTEANASPAIPDSPVSIAARPRAFPQPGYPENIVIAATITVVSRSEDPRTAGPNNLKLTASCRTGTPWPKNFPAYAGAPAPEAAPIEPGATATVEAGSTFVGRDLASCDDGAKPELFLVLSNGMDREVSGTVQLPGWDDPALPLPFDLAELVASAGAN